MECQANKPKRIERKDCSQGVGTMQRGGKANKFISAVIYVRVLLYLSSSLLQHVSLELAPRHTITHPVVRRIAFSIPLTIEDALIRINISNPSFSTRRI